MEKICNIIYMIFFFQNEMSFFLLGAKRLSESFFFSPRLRIILKNIVRKIYFHVIHLTFFNEIELPQSAVLTFCRKKFLGFKQKVYFS